MHAVAVVEFHRQLACGCAAQALPEASWARCRRASRRPSRPAPADVAASVAAQTAASLREAASAAAGSTRRAAALGRSQTAGARGTVGQGKVDQASVDQASVDQASFRASSSADRRTSGHSPPGLSQPPASRENRLFQPAPLPDQATPNPAAARPCASEGSFARSPDRLPVNERPDSIRVADKQGQYFTPGDWHKLQRVCIHYKQGSLRQKLLGGDVLVARYGRRPHHSR